MRILTPPGVFQPRSDTWMLARAVAELAPRGAALDLCTGSGAVAIAAARCGASVTAVDAHRRSAWTARLNARLNGVRVRALHGDLFEPVSGERFDLVTANPPYVPAPPGLAPQRGDRAWNAGCDGRAVIDRLIDGLPGHLTPGGVALLVQSSVTGVGATLERLAAAGLEPEIAQRRRGPLGPILAARAGYLAAEGLLRGRRLEEELLVIRATASPAARAQASAAQMAASTAPGSLE